MPFQTIVGSGFGTGANATDGRLMLMPPLVGGYASFGTTSGLTEAQAQLVWRNPGTIDRPWAAVSNTRVQSNTFGIRINGVLSACAITLPPSTGGLQSGTGSARFADGDLVDLGTIQDSGGSGTFLIVNDAFRFHPDSGSSVAIGCATVAGNAIASTNGFTPMFAFMQNTTEANAQMPANVGGTLSRLRVSVISNTYSQALTIRTRINGANGNQSVTIPSATTGDFEDTTNSDVVAATDLVNFNQTSVAGTGNASAAYLACRLSPTVAGQYPLVGYIATGGSITATFKFLNFCGRPVGSNTQATASAQSRMQHSAILSRFGVKVSANAATVASTGVLQVAGVNQAPTITIPGATTGTFQDTTNSATINSGQLFGAQFTGQDGTITILGTFLAVQDTTIEGTAAQTVGTLSSSGIGHVNPSGTGTGVVAPPRATGVGELDESGTGIGIAAAPRAVGAGSVTAPVYDLEADATVFSYHGPTSLFSSRH